MSKHDCLEYECSLSFDFREELLAHLSWDHNHSEREAEGRLTDNE